MVGTENFADRSELGTEECFRVIDEIAAFAPECLTILTGGEPLLRRDILEIVRRASERELWVVVGTNGVRITENVARRLAEAGARGLSLSLDALDPDRHDRFRKVRGAWRNTVEGAEILNRTGLPFIVQTTAGSHNLGELEAIADFALRSPRRQSLEPLLPGADRARAVRVGHHPRAVRRGSRLALPDPEEVRPPHAREREVRSALHQDRSGECPSSGLRAGHRLTADAKFRRMPSRRGLRCVGLSSIRTYSGGAGGCPAGTHYMGIRPNGDVTPCPYLPVFAGTLRNSSLADLWTSSELFVGIRRRTSLGGRCGECEMNGHCGGCRARAYGMTGDLMAEDPLCTHTPGRFAGSPLLTLIGAPRAPSAEAGGARPPGPILEYGPESPTTVAWDDAAAARMKKIPAFVRGMVVRAVEESCRKSGLERVTVEGARKDPRADADAEDLWVDVWPCWIAERPLLIPRARANWAKAESIVRAKLKAPLVIDFGPSHGLWQFVNDSTWTALHGLSSEGLSAGRFQ